MRERFASAALVLALLGLAEEATAQVLARSLSAGFTSTVSSNGVFGIKGTVGESVTGLTSGSSQIGSGFLYADSEAKLPEAIDSEIGLPSEIPDQFDLHQNYPNPFNPTTNILISLPKRTRARIEVYNSIGQRVAVLVDEELRAGTHLIEWNGRTDSGQTVASGMYLYRLVAGDYAETRTMTLLR